MLRKTIGINLKRCREKLHLSQHAVAEKCGLEQKDISKIENYVENVGVDKIDQICKGLGICPYELMIAPDEISAKDLLEKKFFMKGVFSLLYYMLSSQIHNEEISSKPYTSYGIGVSDNSVPCIEDISTDKDFVEGLVKLCNTFQLDPIHLKEYIEDSLIKI